MICIHCKKEHPKDHGLELDDGEFVCDGCDQDRCYICHRGECEVETRRGDYMCSDCYSGEIDNAYERMREG